MIYSWSKFNYGQIITIENNFIAFDEGSGELLAELEAGDYTLGELASEIASAMTGTGALDYAVTIDRDGNFFTISANGNFSLLIATASTSFTVFQLIGFTGGADLTGDDSYQGLTPCGSEYKPQFKLQSYSAPEDNVESVEGTVNRAASGNTELVRFGTESMIEMDIKFITNLVMDGLIIRNNPEGLEDARAFFNYITQKARFEFVPDESNPDVFYKVILEKTPASPNGTGFKFRELYTDGLPDIYETGVIELRVVA